MGKLTWQSYGESFYEHGVDRVVAYPEGGVGLAWSGVSTISEKNDATVDGYYLDGLKYVQVPSYGEYGATLESYSIPSGLNLCLGFAQLSPGLFATNQRRRSFSLSYRTLIGNEDSDRIAYKLHLVYNAVATPSFGGSATIKDAPEPTTHSFELSTMPPGGSVPNLRPTAHLILDSRHVPSDVMEDIERILYGTDILEPRLPLPNEILMLTQAPAYTVSWDGAPDASASRLVRRTGELMAKNLATNPSFEATGGTSGTVEVRRNLALSPLGVGSLPGYGAQTVTEGVVVSGHPEGIATATRIAYTSGQVNPGLRFTTTDLVAGTTYTISAWVYVESQTVALGYGFGISGVTSEPSRTLAEGVWTRLSWTVTPTAPGAPGIRHAAVGGAGAGSYLITGMLVEQSPILVPFFAPGLPSPDSDLTPSWTGAPNASASVLTGEFAVAAGAVSSMPIISSQWASHGTRSMRITTPFAFNHSSVRVAGSPTSLTGAGVTFVAGRTYTVMARLRLAAPQTGELDVQARCIRAAGNTVSGWSGATNVLSAQAPNTAGVHEQRLTFTIPEGAVWWEVDLFNGALLNGGDVWWDDLAIIEGEYAGEWFDGSNLPD